MIDPIERRELMIGRRSFLRVTLIVLFALFCLYGQGMSEERYSVKSGDSLYTISKSFGISVETLKEANGLKRSAIQPKQILIIPNPQERQKERTVKKSFVETEPYRVKQGDSLYVISKRVGLSIEEIKRMNRLQSNALKTGQKLFLPKRGLPIEEELEEMGDMEEVKENEQSEGEKEMASEPIAKWGGPEERNLFVRVVKTFLGVPYRLGGATLKGIDCSAFVKRIYEIFNISLPRTTREQLHSGKKVEREELEEGDLVFFKTRRRNNAHVGIYIGNNEFVHASYRTREVRIDSLNTPYFYTRFIKGVRIKELERES